MRWFRGIAAATVALAAVMGVMVVTTSSAAAQGREMCITRFFVDDTEDVGADGDEPYLKVNTVFWRAPGSIDEPEDGEVNKGVEVNETVHADDIVQAWDDDSPDDDDFIGAKKVLDQNGTGTLDFRGDDAHYRAYYRPGRC